MDQIISQTMAECAPRSKGGIVLAAILGIILGLTVGFFSGSTAGKTTSVMNDTADFRVKMNILAEEHADKLAAMLRTGFLNSPDFASAAESLDENSQEMISSLPASVADKDRLLENWRNGINSFVNYTIASKSGDRESMSVAGENLNASTEELVGRISIDFPSMDKETLAGLFAARDKAVKESVDAFSVGDYAASYSKQKDVASALVALADLLSRESVK